jgi:tetratricopeptide (TPR) repeat protein
VTALRNVGALYQEQGQHDKAEEAMKRALDVAQSSEPPGAPDGLEVGRILADLATLRLAEADPEAAEPLYRRALASLEAAGAIEVPELRTVLRNLGRLANAKGDYDAAEQFLERALAMSERALGPDDREVAATHEDLAWVRFSRRSLHER